MNSKHLHHFCVSVSFLGLNAKILRGTILCPVFLFYTVSMGLLALFFFFFNPSQVLCVPFMNRRVGENLLTGFEGEKVRLVPTKAGDMVPDGQWGLA